MKAVVTGGAGFIGSNLARALVAAGYETHVIDNLASGKREDVPEGATLHQLDITDTDAIRPVLDGADAVFHLAALPRVSYSFDFPQESHRANIDGTFSVLMAARDGKVRRVVYAASSSAYGAQDRMPFTEDMTARPMSLYAFQKFAGEEYARLFAELYGLEAVSLRFFTVYGPGMRPDGGYALAIPRFLQNRKDGVPLPITGDGEQTRDFTHVADVVRACMLAAASPEVGKGEVFNVAAGRNVSVNHLADLIGGPREYVPVRPGDVPDTYGDNRKAREVLGWEPQVALEDGIRELKAEWGIA
jgi:UDP-glucose 4-epimerase